MITERELRYIATGRRRARTDLLWLCHNILEFTKIAPHVHGPMIGHLQEFQPQGEDLVTPERFEYTPPAPDPVEVLQGQRKRLLLAPRGWYKTSLNIEAHSVQWILNFPDITILLIHASQEMAEQILNNIKRHFQLNTVMRYFFPEFCPSVKREWGTQQFFDTPARKSYTKSPTMQVAGIETIRTGMHYHVIKFTDIVDEKNTTTREQCEKIVYRYGMARNLLISPRYWMDIEGTRYHFCLAGDTTVTMFDWSEKPISEVRIGDEIVGWHFENGKGKPKRRLVRAKVIARGSLRAPVKKYTFASGRNIVCTPEHKFWRGKQWMKNEKNREYSEIARLKSVRRLMIPVREKTDSWATGWLAGFYDGEGTFCGNPGYPSGQIVITQSMHNPELIGRTRQALKRLKFPYRESWHRPSKAKNGQTHWTDRCNFCLLGGWKERYRFLQEVAPFRREKIVESLYGQLMTDADKIVKIEDAGVQEVFWIQTETGNYIADGVCSANSDLYGRIIDEWMKEEEQGKAHQFQVFVMPCYKRDLEGERFTPDELDKPFLYGPDGQPISRFPEEFSVEKLEEMRKDQVTGEEVFATQQLNNPIASDSQTFPLIDMKWKTPEEIQRIPMQYAITTVDLAETTGKRSDNTVITTCLVDRMNRRHVVDIRMGKFLPDATVDHIFMVQLKYRPAKIKIEETGFTRGLLPTMRRRSEMTGIWPNFEFIKRDNQAGKIERILGLQPWYKSGCLYFSTDLPIHVREELKHQLTRFPKYAHDDILDTLADQFQGETTFGPLKESPTMKQVLITAQEKMLENLDKYEVIFGKRSDGGSWSGLGAL